MMDEATVGLKSLLLLTCETQRRTVVLLSNLLVLRTVETFYSRTIIVVAPAVQVPYRTGN